MRIVRQQTVDVIARRPSRAGKMLAATALVATIVTGTIAVASASTRNHDDGQTIRLRSTLVSATTNSAGQNGPGDVVALVFSFTTSRGTTGHADISCMIFPNDEQLCHAAFVFPNGQIDAQAAIPLSATTFDAAVIGGTGSYNGASGQIHNAVSAPGVIDRTIRLLDTED